MKTHRAWRRFLASLATLLLVCCFGTTAFAYEAIDTGREASLTVCFVRAGVGFPGVDFRV